MCSGEEPGPKLKANNEYPPWLFELDVNGTVAELEDCRPDSWQYWREMRKRQIDQVCAQVQEYSREGVYRTDG